MSGLHESDVSLPAAICPDLPVSPWGGRRLAELLSTPLPGGDRVGEAWLLSDRDDHASLVAGGPLTGKTLKELLGLFSEEMLGKLSGRLSRFPTPSEVPRCDSGAPRSRCIHLMTTRRSFQRVTQGRPKRGWFWTPGPTRASMRA